MENKTKLETSHWALIFFLSILAGFVVLSWKIYDHFNYVLLEKAQQSDWKSSLLKWQVILSILIPPTAGWLSDYYTKKGKNYLFITLSMGITAMIFLATAFLSLEQLVATAANILPFIMILWMTGMHLFFSPAINLIKKSAKRAHLSIAVGIILLVVDLIYALNKYIIKGAEQLGSFWIFAGAGVFLLMLSIFFTKFNKGLPVYLHPDDPADSMNIWIRRALVIGIFGGICKGLLSLASLNNLSVSLHISDILNTIIFCSAFVVFILAFVLKNQSSTKILLIGALFYFSGLILTKASSGSFLSYISLAIIILGISLVSLSIYSVALVRVPEKQYNFAFGIFYAGFSLSGYVFADFILK